MHFGRNCALLCRENIQKYVVTSPLYVPLHEANLYLQT